MSSANTGKSTMDGDETEVAVVIRPRNFVPIFAYFVAALSLLVFAGMGYGAYRFIAASMNVNPGRPMYVSVNTAQTPGQPSQTRQQTAARQQTSQQPSNYAPPQNAHTPQASSNAALAWDNQLQPAKEPEPGQYGYINGSNVYLRPAPKRNGGKVFFQRNDLVKLLRYSMENDGKWFAVEANGKRGWVHADLITVIPEGTPISGSMQASAPDAGSSHVAAKPPAETINKKRKAGNFVKEGKSYWQQQNWKQAYECFDKAYNLNPTNEIKLYRENALKNIQSEEEMAAKKRQQEKN
jgi:tetratricopeptide (TPR) repeat protein